MASLERLVRSRHVATNFVVATSIAARLRNAVAESAREVCFLLAGTVRDGVCTVSDIERAPNRARSRSFFVVERDDYQRALDTLRRRTFGTEDREVFGVFHSHLGTDNRPSPDDIRSMREHGGIWLIGHLTSTRDLAMDGYYFDGVTASRIEARLV